MAGLIGGAGAPARAAELPLPVPDEPMLLPNIGATADRLRMTILPAGTTATDDQAVDVRTGPDGAPVGVSVLQQTTVTGHGDYAVVERGPARAAAAVGDAMPATIKAGAVSWLGFLPPGEPQQLGALLTLDPAYEASRLPVSLSLTGLGAAGAVGTVTGPGTVTLTLRDRTSGIEAIPTGEVTAAALAGPLDVLRRAAAHPDVRPPVAGDPGLPAVVPAAGPVEVAAAVISAPLRVDGTVTVVDAAGAPLPGATLSGPGVAAVPGGGTLHGVLGADVTFTLAVPAAGRVLLDLAVVPELDPRTLAPPGGATSWAAWARRPRSAAERAAALDTLALAAAASARIRSVRPYLDGRLPGDARTTFRYQLATAVAAPPALAAAVPASARGIAAVSLAALLLLGNAELIRRRL